MKSQVTITIVFGIGMCVGLATEDVLNVAANSNNTNSGWRSIQNVADAMMSGAEWVSDNGTEARKWFSKWPSRDADERSGPTNHHPQAFSQGD